MKKCYKCNEVKPLDLFYRHPRMSDGRINKCRVCTMRDSREYYKATDKSQWLQDKRDRYHKYRTKQKDSRYKKMCGVGLEWIENKLKEQNGLCALCKKPGKLVLDHDHVTKKPRAMLHTTCNAALGLLKDDFDTILNAARYIQDHKGII